MVGEVEARIKEHDKEARSAVTERLDAIRLLVDGAISDRSMPSATLADQPISDSAGTSFGLPTDAEALREIDQELESRHSSGTLLTDGQLQDESAVGQGLDISKGDAVPQAQHRRDVTYVGIAGAFLGAGVVAAVKALFS